MAESDTCSTNLKLYQLSFFLCKDLYEGLKLAQRGRLDNQRGTEINFEMPDFLKRGHTQVSTANHASVISSVKSLNLLPQNKENLPSLSPMNSRMSEPPQPRNHNQRRDVFPPNRFPDMHRLSNINNPYQNHFYSQVPHFSRLGSIGSP